MINNTYNLIASLGGRVSIRRAIGISSSAISNWLRLGIPRSRWPDLIDLGRQRGISEAKMLQALRLAERNHAGSAAPRVARSQRLARPQRVMRPSRPAA